MTAEKKSSAKKGTIKIRQTGSSANAMMKQRGTIKGLGLGRIGKVRELEDTAAVRGMIEKVKHLVKIEQ